MPFAKGHKRLGGRKPNQPNKVTKELKEMILGALDEMGGQRYLKEQATTNPNAFLTLLGKVIPAELKGAGPNGEHLARIEVRIVDPAIQRST